MYNESSLSGICATLAYALGIEPPSEANPKNEALAEYVDKVFSGERADRVFMYNPDAIAEWIFRKYPALTKEVSCASDVEIPLRAVMPSVTPVCFGTMYTGAMPEVHGIQKYEKPVIKIDTIFDALIRAGRRPVIISTESDSLSKIYLERDMDYFILESQDAVNAKTAELILEDKYDFYVVYNVSYDTQMHRTGPESLEALAELRVNARAFRTFTKMIEEHWTGHNTLVGFAMDHGCHEIDGGCGSHGLDMEEDLNIVHLYKGYKRV